MRVLHTSLGLVLFLLCPSFAIGDGLIYQLPADGTWAKFSIQGRVLDSEDETNDPVLNITGNLLICSVGVVQDNGEPCRWIEIVIDGQRDGRAFKEVDKLLIPEAQLGAGKHPLKYLRDAWYSHSKLDKGKARRLKGKEKGDIANVQRVRSIFHPPFENVKKASQVAVDCKLGNVHCECVTADEKENRPGSNIGYESSYTIHLHPDAPFGVAAWHATNRVRRKNELVGVTKLTLTLVDFGDGATSSIDTTE